MIRAYQRFRMAARSVAVVFRQSAKAVFAEMMAASVSSAAAVGDIGQFFAGRRVGVGKGFAGRDPLAVNEGAGSEKFVVSESVVRYAHLVSSLSGTCRYKEEYPRHRALTMTDMR